MHKQTLIRQIFDRESCTYCYLIADSKTGQAVLIDPVMEQTGQYLALLEELGLELIYALDTHIHADHITALGLLREHTGCETVMNQLSHAQCVSREIVDGDVIEIGATQLVMMATPGHTDDSCCYYLEADGQAYIFTGDTLLIRGTGRTDFQNGDAATQYDSIMGRLMALDEQTIVYPGHDYKGQTRSTIGEEKLYNPRLQVENKAAYIALMNGLNLPNPKLMDVAVSANKSCGL